MLSCCLQRRGVRTALRITLPDPPVRSEGRWPGKGFRDVFWTYTHQPTLTRQPSRPVSLSTIVFSVPRTARQVWMPITGIKSILASRSTLSRAAWLRKLTRASDDPGWTKDDPTFTASKCLERKHLFFRQYQERPTGDGLPPFPRPPKVRGICVVLCNTFYSLAVRM